MDPTVRSTGKTGRWHNKCRPTSPLDRRPCCLQSFDPANPRPATRPFVACRCEFVPDLRAPGLCVKDSDKGLDAQKFVFGVLNNW